MLLQPIERLRISMIPPLGSKHTALSVFSEPFRLTFVAIQRSPSSPDPLWAAPSPSYSSIRAIESLTVIYTHLFLVYATDLFCSKPSLVPWSGPTCFVHSFRCAGHSLCIYLWNRFIATRPLCVSLGQVYVFDCQPGGAFGGYDTQSIYVPSPGLLQGCKYYLVIACAWILSGCRLIRELVILAVEKPTFITRSLDNPWCSHNALQALDGRVNDPE